MRSVLTITFAVLFLAKGSAQLEISTGYAVNRDYADGAPLHIAYDFKLKNKAYTKSQIGYKYLHYYDDFVDATLKVIIWEFHQTFSYEVIKKIKYVFKPNLGFNYRFYKWKAEMHQPLNSLPIRASVTDTRHGKFVIVSRTGEDYREYETNNIGFTIQLQNQFQLKENVWLHITPFLEPDYDRFQNTGGCYVGLILKEF